MRSTAALFTLLAASLLATCAAPEAPPRAALPALAGTGAATAGMALPDGLWRLPDATPALKDASCPSGTAPTEPLPIPLTVSPLDPAEKDAIGAALPTGTTLVGAWDLASPHATFGGLSGLARLPEEDGGGLLAVTDAGAFVWLGLESGVPTSARIAYMRGADGGQLSGKTETDAEALVYAGGLALVSFERDFRIEAFALGVCGSAARAARIAGLPAQHGGRRIDANQGPEALFLEPDGTLSFGYEGMLGISPLGVVTAEGRGEWTGARAPAPALHGLVAMERIALADGTVRTIELYRAWDPARGNRIQLRWGEDGDEALTLARPLPVDNFEGLAAELTEAGKLRIWIVSDDNFSPSQRTLLYVFDISLAQG